MINANLLPRQPITHVTAADPDRLLLDVVSRVKIPALQEFLTAVTHEPEIYMALTTATFVPMNASARPAAHARPAIRRKQASAPASTYPIQALRRASEMASYCCACGAEERDVLFVATLLQGVQRLLVAVVHGDSTVEEVMFTLVRRSFHRLDDHAPRCSRLLRLALGWGYADEIDDFYVPRLQYVVQRALSKVDWTPAMRPPATSSRDNNPRSLSIKGAEQCSA